MAEFTLLITDSQLEALLVENLNRPPSNRTRPNVAAINALIDSKIKPQLTDKLNEYSDRR